MSPEPVRAWRELTTEHFVLRTDLGRERARTLAGQLEHARAGLVRVILGGQDRAGGRLDVVAFASEHDFAPYALAGGSPEVEGFLAKLGRTEDVMVLGPIPEFRQQLVVSHELAHHLLTWRFPRQPRWFAEGMAEYLASVSRPPSTRYAVGLPLFPNELETAREHPVKVRELLGWSAPAPDTWPYYVGSKLLVHFLHKRHPERFGEFEVRLAAGARAVEAWNEAFPGWSLAVDGAPEELDRELAAYALAQDEAFEVYEVRAPAGGPRERRLSSAEALVLRLELPREWEPGELERHLERALEVAPSSVAALALKAELEPSAAPSLALRAVRGHPEDPRAWLLRAQWPGARDAEAVRSAALAKAATLGPEDPRVQLAMARNLLEAERPREALDWALRAEQYAPRSGVAPFLAARALARLGSCDEARAKGDRTIALSEDESGRAPEDVPELLEELVQLCRRARAAR